MRRPGRQKDGLFRRGTDVELPQSLNSWALYRKPHRECQILYPKMGRVWTSISLLNETNSLSLELDWPKRL